LLSAASTSVLVQACKKDSETTSASGSSSSSGTCSEAPTETEGPYPTKTPASYVRSDIRDDRTGYKLTIKITVTNKNSNCAALSGALVDIWHCDAEGNYSEYGGSGSQSTNYQTVHFLRGRQTTDSNGLASFTSIFPGWYTGRATHIHVHIYNAAGTSLKVTQIAFPEGSDSALVAVGGYKKGFSGYIYNTDDNVFSDGYSLELATITGNTTDGFVLNISFAVAA